MAASYLASVWWRLAYCAHPLTRFLPPWLALTELKESNLALSHFFRCAQPVKIAVIGGSGLYNLEGLEFVAEVNPETVCYTHRPIEVYRSFFDPLPFPRLTTRLFFPPPRQ